MLMISQLSITNFRSIPQETFALPALTVLVGKNDVGKSNLLEAIQILLEGSANSVDAEDFYDATRPIEFLALLDGVADYLELCDEKNRPKIEQRIDKSGTVTIRRIANAPKQLTKLEILDPKTGEFGTPTGIDAAIRAMLPEVISIEALADVAEETKGTQKDTLGKLVGQVVSGITDRIQPQIDAAFVGANRLLNVQQNLGDGTELDERAVELQDIEREVSRYLKETFPNSAVRLRVQMPSVKDLLGQIGVFVREGGHEDPYYRRGHGLQRTLYLSLLRALAARIREGQAVSRPFILLFEEPEAFLHPEGQTKMRTALQAISTQAQVVLATHSPIIVTPDLVGQTVRIEKRREDGFPKPVTRRFGPIDIGRLNELQRQLIPLFALQRSSRFLFSRGVLLVEGTGDEYLFSAIAERLRQFRLDSCEISIVETGGKDRVPSFAEILRMLGLSVWAMVDLDFLWSGAGLILGADAELSQFVESLERIAPSPPRGAPDEERRENKRLRKEACRTQLAAERDGLCERLLQSQVFVLREGEIEDYVDLGRHAKSRYIIAADEIRSGARPINHQRDFEIIIEALAAWAQP